MAVPRTRRRARAPRRESGTDGATTLAESELELRFQTCPGTGSDKGIPSLEIRVDVGHGETLRRTTDADGCVRFPAPAADQVARVRVVDPAAEATTWASYEVVRRVSLPPQGDPTGARARLALLGYPAGDETQYQYDAALEESMLQFQADHGGDGGLPCEGVRTRGILNEPHSHIPLPPGTSAPVEQLHAATMDLLVRIIREQHGDLSVDPEPEGGSRLGVPRRRRIVLARFVPPNDHDADETPAARPEIDDRGSTGDVKGPWLGLLTGSTVTVDLVREPTLPASTPLHVVKGSGSANVSFRDASPVASGRRCRVTIDPGTAAGDAVAEVRLGSATGPVVHRMKIFVRAPIRLAVAMFRMRVNMQDPTATDAEIHAAFAELNRVYAPAGIQFHLAHLETGETLTVDSTVDYRLQLQQVFASRRYAQCINVYLVGGLPCMRPRIAMGAGTSAGIRFSNERDDHSVARGVVALDAAIKAGGRRALAHEMGHYFDLQHPDEDAMRLSTWAVRRLMFRIIQLDGMVAGWQPRQHFIGSLLTLKHLSDPGERDGTGENDDGEVDRLRSAAANPYDGIEVRGSWF